jgi:ATP-dependent Zn protease
VFELHLRKRGLQPETFDIATLAASADGFSGAEIEQAVVAALYAAHAENARSTPRCCSRSCATPVRCPC